MPSIGENIRRLRTAAGYKTQGAFASAIGVPQPRLSDWENDRYGVPEIPNLLRIAKKLKVSVNQLLAGFDDARTTHYSVTYHARHVTGRRRILVEPAGPVTS